MEVVHPGGDLLGPLHQLLGRYLLAVPEKVEEGAVGAVLNHNAEHGGTDRIRPCKINHYEDFSEAFKLINTNSKFLPELHNFGVFELPEVLDVGLVLLLDLLDGDLLLTEDPSEHGALGPGAEPAEVPDILEGDFPVIP